MEEEDFIYADDNISESERGCITAVVGCVIGFLLLALVFAVGILVSYLR